MSYLINQPTETTIRELSLTGVANDGQSYLFNNNNSIITLPNKDIGVLDGTIFFEVSWITVPTDTRYLFTRSAGNNRWIVLTGSGFYRLTFVNGAGATTEYITTVPVQASDKSIALTLVRGGEFSLYINGTKKYSASISANSGINFGDSNANAPTIGRATSSVNCNLSAFKLFNCALTEADIAELTANKTVIYKYNGGTTTAQTSGTLTTGKLYRITAFASGDDFTNVGASSNANGVEFIATGTTPTTWTNSSGVTQIGCFIDYKSDHFSSAIAYDISGGSNHGTTSNTTLTNRAMLVADTVAVLQNLPTSSAGLGTGRLWNDTGTIKIA